MSTPSENRAPRIVLAGAVNSSRLTFEALLRHKAPLLGVLGLSPEPGRRASGLSEKYCVEIYESRPALGAAVAADVAARIRQVAARLRAEVRDYDMVARMAGDEFAIAICEPEDRAAVEGICARIIEQLARPFDLFGARAYIGARA